MTTLNWGQSYSFEVGSYHNYSCTAWSEQKTVSSEPGKKIYIEQVPSPKKKKVINDLKLENSFCSEKLPLPSPPQKVRWSLKQLLRYVIWWYIWYVDPMSLAWNRQECSICTLFVIQRNECEDLQLQAIFPATRFGTFSLRENLLMHTSFKLLLRSVYEFLFTNTNIITRSNEL